jgi:hypothetical protein
MRRIFFVWAKFVAAVSIFLLIALGTHRTITAAQVVLSYLGLASLGNSSWYIFAILLMYIVTYFAFKICGRQTGMALTFVLVVSLLYMLVADKMLPDYYFDTILCYFAGMVLSNFKATFDGFVGRNWTVYLTTSLGMAVVFVATYLVCAYTTGIVHYVMYEVAAIAFAMLFVLLAIKFRLNNPVLRYMGGGAMFSIYVLQRIPMIFGAKTALLGRPVLFFIVVLLATVVIGWLFDQVVDRALRKMLHK